MTGEPPGRIVLAMHAIAARPGTTEPALVPAADPPLPVAGEVLCRTLELGVCGTDREILETANPLRPEGEDHLVLGHEALARVEQVGEGVDEIAPGDLVVPVVRRSLGTSPQRVDMLAFGDYTERGIVWEHGFSLPRWIDRPGHLFRVDAQVAVVAVLAEPLSIAEKGINEALLIQRARLGDQVWTDPPPRVLVTGMGPIGFAGMLAARARDWPVVMYGRDDEESFRARLARDLGGEYLSADRFDPAPADVERDGYDLILECTGSDEVTMRVAGSLASRGVMVWLGSSRLQQPKPHNVELLMRSGLLRNHVLLGCVNSAPRDFVDALAHLAQLRETHARQIEALITARVSPADSLWHYVNRSPQGIKTVVEFA